MGVRAPPAATSAGTLAYGRGAPRAHLQEGLTIEVKRLIGIPGGNLAGNLGAFLEIAADHHVGGRRAGAIGLLEPAVAAVEADGQPVAPFAAARGLGVEQCLHLVAPLLAF